MIGITLPVAYAPVTGHHYRRDTRKQPIPNLTTRLLQQKGVSSPRDEGQLGISIRVSGTVPAGTKPHPKPNSPKPRWRIGVVVGFQNQSYAQALELEPKWRTEYT